METDYETYLRHKLEWAKLRLKMLDEIESKLSEMKSIAIKAADSSLSITERQELNHLIHTLEKEINEMDAKSKTFWMDCQ
jgi:hypothetical protein